ncbi:hypothetical protein ACJEN1_24680, partial [Escherichia coli]
MALILTIPDDLARRVEAAGKDPARIALDALQAAANALSATEAAARIRARRQGRTLGGATIKELINDGRP